MRLRNIIFGVLVCSALVAFSQPTQQVPNWEWYLEEVVSETFVGRNYFEYYYTPSAADMRQQQEQGEVTYFLNSPEGLNSKKVRDMIDRLMASYDDIRAVGDWHMTSTTYWKEFRYEKNKFRFSVKRKALDDGTYYVSVTETAGYYKSLGKKNSQKPESATRSTADKPTMRHSKSDRKPVVLEDNEVDKSMEDVAADEEMEQQPPTAPALSTKEQRKLETEKREAERREQRAKQRREQEKQREEAKAKKEAEKLKKAEEKKQRQEEERLKKEEKRREQEQRREQERQERAARQQASDAAKKPSSRYHYTDVALWLSEKYDFTQTAMSDNSCTMFSTIVKDADMAKLAIKNALKGSNARMAVPWRLNSATQAVETGYSVDDHILVFAIGKDADGQVTLSITEVSNDEFELFKQNN